MPSAASPALNAAIAAHRFGLGEPDLAVIGADPRGWLLAQTGAAEAQRGIGLASGIDGLKRQVQFIQRLQRERPADLVEPAAAALAGGAAPSDGMTPPPGPAVEQTYTEHFREIVQADVRARLLTAALSTRPFNERLALFWANHFTVSMAKASARGIVGAFEREAIRPHVGGRFEDLLKAAVHHPGMLRYLDNDRSAGADSAFVRRRAQRTAAEPRPNRSSGPNENLARELLELHTLGVDGGGRAYGGWGGYGQADVSACAAVLTGWRVPYLGLMAGAASGSNGAAFDPAWHEPGDKQVLGKRYREGPQALDALLHDLAVHPSTARFVCSKLARHFVADDPDPALVARLVAAWQRSDGDLPAVYKALVDAPQAWLPHPAKLKSPEAFVLSTLRLLQLGEAAFNRSPDAGIATLGQRVQAAPSPAGWPDSADEWLGPDAVWKRLEWSTRVADRVGRRVDARALALASLGPLLQPETARQIERAADGPQALALLLLAPEFQRR